MHACESVYVYGGERKTARYIGAADLNIDHARNITRRNLSREGGRERERKGTNARVLKAQSAKMWKAATE